MTSTTDHDPRLPAQWWFQDSSEGLVLFAVFYTQKCRWDRCLGCNLPTLSSVEPVGYQDVVAQVDHLLELPDVKERLGEVRKMILSNNGSVLDQVTFPTTALMYLLAHLNLKVPGMRVLSLETRAEYVEWEELEFLARSLRERPTPAQLELAVGFEAFDDEVRNTVFRKGLPLARFEELAGMVGRYGYALKCYFMQKPVPGMTDQEAVADIHRAIDYLDSVAERFDVTVNMHLNPTFVARGTPLADAFQRGEFVPPRLLDVAAAARHAEGKKVSVFLGLYDEGLAVPDGSFIRPGERALVEHLERFNQSQDYRLLDPSRLRALGG